jgi:signal transduction histidine kinase
MTAAVGIFATAYGWDIFLVEYGIVPFILLQGYGFIAFIIIMSLRLMGQVIEAKKQVRRLNIELERRVKERTADLTTTNQELVKARDAAQVANQAKSVFLANMSHELRTSLNAILDHSQILSRDLSLTPEQKHGVNAVNRSGDHLLTLINSVLEMSKIEAGARSARS